jgi:hypothetical protein
MEYLHKWILPQMLAAKAPDEVLRVWSSGAPPVKRLTHLP